VFKDCPFGHVSHIREFRQGLCQTPYGACLMIGQMDLLRRRRARNWNRGIITRLDGVLFAKFEQMMPTRLNSKFLYDLVKVFGCISQGRSSYRLKGNAWQAPFQSGCRI
jgi:hypothetical protein